VTVRSDQADKNRGLAAGADDYITKPFSVEELTLRVRAVLRRTKASPRMLRVGPLTIDARVHEATIYGQRVELTPLEFDLLRHLATNRDRVVRTAELVRDVWGVAHLAVSDPLVKNAVYRLRRKLSAAQSSGITIANIRGIGYRLVAE
jgi:DNA-binding response OmpR family regulator